MSLRDGLYDTLLTEALQKLVDGLGPGQPPDAGEAPVQLVDLLAQPPRVLRAVGRPGVERERPTLGLGSPWLFTAGKGSPSLLREIRAELASCDGVDILVSFITMSGVRKLRDVLQRITARGGDASVEGGMAPPRLRILTTTYTGATEAAALDELDLPPSDWLRLGLCRQRQPFRCRADRRSRVDDQDRAAWPGSALRARGG